MRDFLGAEYGAVTPEQINSFEFEDIPFLMDAARARHAAELGQYDALLNIPRTIIEVSHLKPANRQKAIQAAPRIRKQLYAPLTIFQRRNTSKINTAGPPIFTMTIADVERKFGTQFVRLSNG